MITKRPLAGGVERPKISVLSAFSTFQAAMQISILNHLGDRFVYGTQASQAA
jgi:hypothetical protein